MLEVELKPRIQELVAKCATIKFLFPLTSSWSSHKVAVNCVLLSSILKYIRKSGENWDRGELGHLP